MYARENTLAGVKRLPCHAQFSKHSYWGGNNENRDAHSLQLARMERFPGACIIVHPGGDALPEDVLREVGRELAHDRLEANGAVLAGTFTTLFRFPSSAITFDRGGHFGRSMGKVGSGNDQHGSQQIHNAKIQA